MKRAAVAIAAALFAVPCLFAQAPVQVSLENHKVEIENAQVRVLRAKLGPREKVPMHRHPESVLVFLTDVHEKITTSDGTVQEFRRTKGATSYLMEVTHTEENLSDRPLEVIIIELKPGAGPAQTSSLSPDFDPVKINDQQKSNRERYARRILESNLINH